MKITDVPLVSVSLGGGLKVGDIREGRDVYLECNIKANPPAHETLWHFNETTELHTDKEKGEILLGIIIVFINYLYLIVYSIPEYFFKISKTFEVKTRPG